MGIWNLSKTHCQSNPWLKFELPSPEDQKRCVKETSVEYPWRKPATLISCHVAPNDVFFTNVLRSCLHGALRVDTSVMSVRVPKSAV